MITKGHRDLPISKLLDDKLGATPYVESLAEFILECKTPMTIAIQGDWGSGKTSIMALVRDQLSDSVSSFWFNTWQYAQFQMHDYLAVSLLHGFLDSIQGEKCLKEKVIGLAKSMSGQFAGAAKTFALEKTLGHVNAERLTENHADGNFAQTIETLKAELVHAVDERLSKIGSERLVIFIDDLDRLPPEKAVEILEVMKIFMDIEHCVFVLAIDYSVVIQGVRKKYSETVDDEKGKSFFDKIIQLPFSVPVSQYNIDEYLKELLENLGHQGQELLSEKTIIRKLVENSVGRNPRSIKRVFNTFLLLNRVAEKKGLFEGGIPRSVKARIIFGLLCLQTSFDQVYELFCESKDSISDDFFDELLDDESYLKSESPFFVSFREAQVKNLSIPQLISFWEVFKESIQIDEYDAISNEETENLKTLLAFSSLTSVSDDKQHLKVSTAGKFKTAEDFSTSLKEGNRKYFLELHNEIKDFLASKTKNFLVTYSSNYVSFKNPEVGKKESWFLKLYFKKDAFFLCLHRKDRREKLISDKVSYKDGDYYYELKITTGDKLTLDELELIIKSYQCLGLWK